MNQAQIHPTAIISEEAIIDESVKIMRNMIAQGSTAKVN